MYNLRIKEFYDTQQIQLLSKAQRQKGEVLHRDFDIETGEIFESASGVLMDVPFEDGRVRVKQFHSYDVDEVARRSCSRTIKAIYDIARSNRWMWFVTFTFNGAVVNRYDYTECTQKLSDWLANMRRCSSGLKYVVVPEQHKDGAWHFHGLMSDCEGIEFRFSGHRDKKGRRIYNIHKYRFGWTTATRVTDFRRSSSYLCKYVTKDLCAVTHGKRRYWRSLNLDKPIVHEFLLTQSYEYNMLELLKCCEESVYVKTLDTCYTRLTYIDGVRQSIPQTQNGLSKVKTNKNIIGFDTGIDNEI